MRVEDAFRREKQIQGWTHRKKQVLIEQNLGSLVAFSRNYTEFGKDGELMDGDDLASASTGSACADDGTLPRSQDIPLPELVEGSDGESRDCQ